MVNTTCLRCHRHLKDPISQGRSYGPKCWRIVKAQEAKDRENSNVVEIINKPMREFGLICERREGGVAVNVPWLHKHHSPTGLEWGYGGSGPADLALNVLEHMVFLLGDELHYGADKVKLSDGTYVEEPAWRLHGDFKRLFISAIPSEGGTIPFAKMKEWILHAQ